MSSNSSTTTAQTVDRDLPDDQFKIEDETEYGEAELQTMERAMDLSKQFERIKDNTVEDGMVLGELSYINTSENSSRIIISIDLPAEGMPIKKRFRKPKRWSDEYAFVRWIRHYGYDAETFPQMIDDKCKVKVEEEANGGDYTVFVPDESRGLRSRAPDVSPIEWYLDKQEPIVGSVIGLATVIVGVGLATTLIQTQYSAPQEFGIFGIMALLALVSGTVEDNTFND